MIDHWDPRRTFDSPLEECVHGSRLLGADQALVLHGGGNTSVKVPGYDLFGVPIDIIYVKGSGQDLASITPNGFAPLDLSGVRRLPDLAQMSDQDMMHALRILRLDPTRPDPSVEAILHAIIPAPSVLHTHADAILAITDTADGRGRIREALGGAVLLVDYVMPGFPLAKVCADLIGRYFDDSTRALVLLKHGIFTFGSSTAQAYHSMIEMVTRAEEYLSDRIGARPTAAETPSVTDEALADLRADISRAAGRPMVMTRCTSPEALRFAARDDLAQVASRGPATPDHVLRTKRIPLIGRDVISYARAYRTYFETNTERCPTTPEMLDPSPRIVVDPTVGILTVGRTVREARIARDIFVHTIGVIEAAEDLGGYWPVTPEDCFDVEYWDLEQAKVRLQGLLPPRSGEVALVTGSASGIGMAAAERLLADGAAVVGVDLSPPVRLLADHAAYVHVEGDVCEHQTARRALHAAATAFGGLDILIIAAGIFPASASIADQDFDVWRRSIEVNLGGGLVFLHASYDLLSRSPDGGRVVLVGSKNVHAPGPGAGAYSVSKAGLNQIARIAALEWAKDGIRVNTVHPDAVFDTAFWSPQVIAERAASYGMTVEAYKRRNLLSVDIDSRDVAGVIVALCSENFSKTTGAQIPIDGGSDRII